MLEKLFAIGRVLNAGEELSNPEIWKERQNLINALLAFFGAALVFAPEEFQMSGESLESIVGGIATVAGLVNAYLTTATTKKIGVKKKQK